MRNARDILAQRVLLFDGGMGTYYKGRSGPGMRTGEPRRPAGVLAVHREYLEAGAEAIKTNTFGLSRMAAGGAEGWQQLAREGWRLACEAAGEDAAVFADLGPAPDTEAGPAGASYRAAAELFLELGAVNFLFETLSTDAGVAETAAYIKSRRPEAFVLVSFASLPDGYTREGVSVRALAARMAACGAVDAVGLNCLLAPSAMRSVMPALAGCGLPAAAMPTAATRWWPGTMWSTRAGPTILPRRCAASGSRAWSSWAGAAAPPRPTSGHAPAAGTHPHAHCACAPAPCARRARKRPPPCWTTPSCASWRRGKRSSRWSWTAPGTPT